MDDQRLSELFRAAAADVEPPPAGFDHDDVLAGSRRIARRQRVTVAAAVVVVAGLGMGALFAGGLGRSEPTSTLAEAPATVTPAAPPPGIAADATAPLTVPDEAGQPVPGPARPVPEAVPGARSKSLAAPPAYGCTAPDSRVFAQLSAVLPAVREARPYPVPGGCGPADSGLAVDLTDGSGTLVVVLTPSGADTRPPDTPTRVSATARARSGGQLRLTASSDGGPTPFRDRLDDLARDIAASL